MPKSSHQNPLFIGPKVVEILHPNAVRPLHGDAVVELLPPESLGDLSPDKRLAAVEVLGADHPRRVRLARPTVLEGKPHADGVLLLPVIGHPPVEEGDGQGAVFVVAGQEGRGLPAEELDLD